jgi:hypothetical protein
MDMMKKEEAYLLDNMYLSHPQDGVHILRDMAYLVHNAHHHLGKSLLDNYHTGQVYICLALDGINNYHQGQRRMVVVV